jgi:hypothetical protein
LLVTYKHEQPLWLLIRRSTNAYLHNCSSPRCVSFYGNVGAEGDTWEEAVASLTSDDWSECFEEGDGGWEQQQRVVHVEDEDGYIVAEDIAFYCR